MEYINAFWVGGAICALVQILLDRTKLMPGRVMVLLVCTGAVLGFLGIYQPFAEFAGGGASVPLLGFGNTLWNGVKEAVEEEGFIGIFLGGFSMGAAMSLYSSVRQVRTLAGCIALSGYFPAADLLEKDVTPAGRGTPVFMAHGAFDSVIPSVLAEHGADLLENTLDTLIWREYNIDHEICQDELMNVAQFMSTALQR